MSDTPITDAEAYDYETGRRWVDGVVSAHIARKLERENAALRSAAVEVCALARVWVTVWGDKLSAESVKHLEELEKKILKEAQP